MTTYVEFASGERTLRGFLETSAARPAPCVLLLHGFGDDCVGPNYLFVRLARRLAAAGVASLRFDFGGCGNSDGAGDFSDVTTSGQVADAGAALDFLRRHVAIAAGRIGVAGHSLGGGVAALLAGRRGADLRAVATLAGTADPARLVAYIRTGKYETQLAERGYFDIDGKQISRPFLTDLDALHPAGALADFPGPALVIQGSRDQSVLPREAGLFEEARTPKGLPTRVEMLLGADHTFASVDAMEQVLGLLEAFFQANL